MCLKLRNANSIGFWGTSELKFILLENSEFQNYFEEQGNCIVQQMSPDHNTPKGKGWLKRTTNYPRPQMNPLLVCLVLETFISLTHPD